LASAHKIGDARSQARQVFFNSVSMGSPHIDGAPGTQGLVAGDAFDGIPMSLMWASPLRVGWTFRRFDGA
jgi:hypothetical protein